MSPYKQEAEVLRLLLCYGCISGAKIITWADETIMAESDIDDNLIELSTESPDKTPALLSRLSAIATNVDKFAAIRTALGRMHDLVANDSAEDLAGFAFKISKIANEAPQPLPDDLQFLFTLDDECADPAVIGKEILQHLKHFKDNTVN